MIDFEGLRRAVECHGTVVRLVLADVQGSAPREAGVSMVIWAEGHEGTIGGGRLEFAALRRARTLLGNASARTACETHMRADADSEDQSQITLAYEVFDEALLIKAEAQADADGVYLRAFGVDQALPPELEAIRHRPRPSQIQPKLVDGWLLEPVGCDRLAVYIYGAGHVGRALAKALAPFEQFDVYLCDVREDQFEDLPDTISQSWDLLPTDIMASAPDSAAHIIMTPEPDYDLELCHRLLSRSFGFAGLIGSARKWERFRAHLQDQGHSLRQIERVHCPVGDPSLGKHPQAIAIGITTQLLQYQNSLKSLVGRP